MSKIKAAYGVAKALGKAYKIGFKARKGVTLTRKAAAYKSAGVRALNNSLRNASSGKMKLANSYLKAAKKSAVNARVAAFDAGRVNRATSRAMSRSKAAKRAVIAGRISRTGAEIGGGYFAGRAIGNKIAGKNKPMTMKQKIALKKAQLASARKRRKS